jgi:hypothetical protein
MPKRTNKDLPKYVYTSDKAGKYFYYQRPDGKGKINLSNDHNDAIQEGYYLNKMFGVARLYATYAHISAT